MASQIWSNSTDYVNCVDFQLVFDTSTIPKINLFNIYYSKFEHRITMSGWPSGLRRQTQEQYSSLTIERSGPRMRAWVRIPLLTKSFFSFLLLHCSFHFFWPFSTCTLWMMEYFAYMYTYMNGHLDFSWKKWHFSSLTLRAKVHNRQTWFKGRYIERENACLAFSLSLSHCAMNLHTYIATFTALQRPSLRPR